jgi:hypothetical protein
VVARRQWVRKASTIRGYELGGDGWSFRQARPGDGEVVACEKHGIHRFQSDGGLEKFTFCLQFLNSFPGHSG